MDGIKVLETEHSNIVDFTNVLRAMGIKAMNERVVEPEDFLKAVDFVRRYSDKQHHGKEEKILFRIMTEHLGPQAQRLIENGMMVEHDLARLYVSQIEECAFKIKDGADLTDDILLDVIGHTMEYANLLQRHAEKENTVLFPFGKRELSPELLEAVNRETEQFEEENAANREEMLGILLYLRNKYI